MFGKFRPPCLFGPGALFISVTLAGKTVWAQGTTRIDAAEEPASVMQILFSGGWPGVLIMLVLIGLSLTAVYLICENFLTIRRSVFMPRDLETEIRELLARRRLAEAEAACQQQPSMLSFILLHGISEVDAGWSGVEKALEDATAEQSARLMRKIEYLSVIGNLAPMVGLLGTVTGMLLTFQKVATTQGAAGAAELAEGIYQALVTTVVGLVIAIPALAAFAFFRNRVDQFVAEAAYLALHSCKVLKRRAMPVAAVATAAKASPGTFTPPPAPPEPERKS
jgi:biopolymer transport protein ExbB